jgi:hypothetical protein
MVMDSFSVGQYWLQPLMVAVVAVLSGIVSCWAWRMMGRISFFQACCGRHYLGFTEAFSPGQVKKAQREQFKAISTETDEKLSRLGRFFIEKIALNRNQPFASFMYGAIYQTLGGGLANVQVSWDQSDCYGCSVLIFDIMEKRGIILFG